MIKNFFKKHMFFFVLSSLLIISGFVSFYRFVIERDYIAGYEGECDPAVSSCFVGCDDDECTEKYFYTKMTKYAPDLYSECGKDITDCESASLCLSSDRKCSIAFCDPTIDGVDSCSSSEDGVSFEDEQFLEENNLEQNI